MSARRRSRPGVPRARSAGSQTGWRRPMPTTSIATHDSLSRRSMPFAPSARSRPSFRPSTGAAACPSRPLRRRASSSGAAAARARWCSRCIRSRLRPSPATPRVLRGSRRTFATSPEDQRLVASVTSEIGTGGDLGKSIAAVTPAEAGRATFEKKAPTVSYGAYADDLLTTLRRSPDAEPGDQVIVLTHRDQFTLEQSGTWDVMGMRGTCSPGYVVRAEFANRPGAADAILDRGPRIDGADLAPPVVAPLARDRHGRVRPGAGVRARPGQGAARSAPADGDAPVTADERAVAAPRGGPHGPA